MSGLRGPRVVEVLARPNDDNRSTRVVDDVRGDAAEEEAPDRPAFVAPDDDEVGAFRFGRLNNRRPCVAFPNKKLRDDPVVARLSHEVRELGFARGPNLIDAGVEQTTRQPETGGVDDTEEDETRPGAGRQL